MIKFLSVKIRSDLQTSFFYKNLITVNEKKNEELAMPLVQYTSRDRFQQININMLVKSSIQNKLITCLHEYYWNSEGIFYWS